MKQSKGESGMEKTKEEKKGLFFRCINGVEVIGNKLPHPFYLFTILIVVAIVLSVIFAGVSVTYESASSKGTGGEIVTVTIKNLLNKETINYVTQNLYSIYYNFSPMMMMGLLMLSIGLAEQVGLFGAFIKRTIAGVPVSYTHLDVYKRQAQYILPAADAAMVAAEGVFSFQKENLKGLTQFKSISV